MANIISFINLKGGVAKTTTTVAVAEILSGVFHKKVLVIDLDPQTNATVMLIGEKKWKILNNEGNTLVQLFKDALEPDANQRSFNIQTTRQIGVSNVTSIQSIDLLPSSLDLIDVQDRLATMSTGQFYSEVPTDILRRAVRPIIDEYDFILIDCPPNLGIITLNGLRISNSYIIPTIPDILSTYGIPQIVSRVKKFADRIGEDIEPLGIVISKYLTNSNVHKNTVSALKDGSIHVFNTIIPQSNQMSDAADYETERNTLKQKWGYSGQEEKLVELTREILEASK